MQRRARRPASSTLAQAALERDDDALERGAWTLFASLMFPTSNWPSPRQKN